MPNPYQTNIVITEHTKEADREPYTSSSTTLVMVAHTQIVHDNLLDEPKEVTDDVSPIRTVQELACAISAMVQQIGAMDPQLAAVMAEASIAQIKDYSAELHPDLEVKPPAPPPPPQVQRIKGEIPDATLTEEQMLNLDLLERNAAYRRKQ